ncbi:late embryogenesis abundant protein [Striga asiatica]|uniref:Late embryogenesis abundant protein n=1 Tax=Striga asiatica TaxID=4170 RepID=A0A5A7QA54_STRAF|nr:late embryogenesis abundant protein [Striga asiatica]
MSEKVCSHHKNKRQKILRRLCAALLVLIFLILIVWAVLQPHKPRFVLQDATIFSLNVSAPNVISTTLQVTITSHNPNSRIGVYYDRLAAYATYHSQQVTYATAIPPVYQGHHDLNVWSPFLYGNNVPVAPYNGLALRQDQSAGAVRLTVKVTGRVKWRVGAFVSGRYHIHVTCSAYIPLGNGRSSGGIVVGDGIKYQLSQGCSVSV